MAQPAADAYYSTASYNTPFLANTGHVKQDGAQNITEIPSAYKSEDSRSDMVAEAWLPGFWKRFPWLAFAAFLGAILLMIIIVIVQVVSNNTPVSAWPQKIPPNVIVQGLNSCITICVAFVVARGLATIWWRKALMGSTVSELHRTWASGTSLAFIARNARFFNVAALAALTTKLTIVDGILYQRAISTVLYTSKYPTARDITTFPTNTLPITGYWNENANTTGMVSPLFAPDFTAWMSSSSGYLSSVKGFYECMGVCNFTVPALGYVAKCNVVTYDNVDIVSDAINSVSARSPSFQSTTDTFDVSFNMTVATPQRNYTSIGLNITTYQATNYNASNVNSYCPARLYHRQCELRLATINYTVFMQYSNVSSVGEGKPRVDVYLGSMDYASRSFNYTGYFDPVLGQVPGFNPIRYVDLEEHRAPWQGTYHGGIVRALKDRYQSRAWINTYSNYTASNTSTNGYSLYNTTANSESALATKAFWVNYQLARRPNTPCIGSWLDPITEIMTGLNALTFITANDVWNRPAWNYGKWNLSSRTDQDTYYNQSRTYVKADEYRTELYYHTNFGFTAGGVATTLLCLFLTLPAYWGFWKLGRKVTLNPIEIANAFQAPALGYTYKSGFADHVVEVAGSRRVKYEETNGSEPGTRMRFVTRE